ncbi:MAG: MBL fold metallo-hydrolase [Patescibacteria group bacterium]
MNKVKVLVEGYAREWGDSGYEASSTVTLISTDKQKILCDPGINWELLKAGLGKEKLKPTDIDWIFLSHTHIDHCYNMARFPKAKLFDGECIYEKDTDRVHGGEIFGLDVEIVKTPGHTTDHTSLLVTTPKGIYAVAGDVFWWLDGKEQKIDPIEGVDQLSLEESRKKLKSLAQFIIPGHGQVFKV